MAEIAEIASVKQLASVPLENLPALSDAEISVLIDYNGINTTVSYLWTRYASTLSGLVDVTESGSSRKLSDLMKNALMMAKSYSVAAADEVLATTGRAHTRAIVRP